jgi:hypothetical protein
MEACSICATMGLGGTIVGVDLHKTTNAALVISARDLTRGERKRYKKNRSSISKAASYQEIGQYWDQKDLDEVWDQTESSSITEARPHQDR